MFTNLKAEELRKFQQDILDCQDHVYRVRGLFDMLIDYGMEELNSLAKSFDRLRVESILWEKIMTDLQSIENRARVYRHLIRAIPGNVCVTLHDTNESTGFMYLDLFADIPQRLNKQREELIGKSVLTVDPAIGEPRFHNIRKSLASGQTERYNYHHDWEGRRWFFSVTVIPIVGTEEIITIVQDNEPTQLDWWLERYEPIGN